MTDHIELPQEQLVEITPEMKCFINETRARMKGTDRRQFMAHVVLIMGKGGQRRAENVPKKNYHLIMILNRMADAQRKI